MTAKIACLQPACSLTAGLDENMVYDRWVHFCKVTLIMLLTASGSNVFHPTSTLPPMTLVFESPVTGLQKDCNWTRLRLQKIRPAVWSFEF